MIVFLTPFEWVITTKLLHHRNCKIAAIAVINLAFKELDDFSVEATDESDFRLKSQFGESTGQHRLGFYSCSGATSRLRGLSAIISAEAQV